MSFHVQVVLLLACCTPICFAENHIDADCPIDDHTKTCVGHIRSEVGEALLQLPLQRKAAVQTIDAHFGQAPGENEPLTEKGYEEVQSTCCILAMELWTRRKIEEMGLEVCFEGGLSGLMPWLSCNPNMTYAMAVEKLEKDSTWKCPWLRQKGWCSSDAWPADCPSGPLNPAWHRRRTCSTKATTTTSTTTAPLPCCKPKSALAQAVAHSNVTTSATSALKPFDCKGHPGPLVSKRPPGATNSDSGFDITELDLVTGRYKMIYHIPATWTNPKFFQVTSTAINPIDGILYGIVCLSDNGNICYVSRMDKDKFEFLGQTKQRVNGADMSSKGKYYFADWSTPAVIYTVPNIHNVAGSADRKKVPLMADALITLTGWDKIIKDVVAYSGTIDKAGTASDYVIAFSSEPWATKAPPSQMLLVKDDGANSKYWILPISKTGEAGAWNGFGIGWSFKGKVYFASGKNMVEEGNDVFEVPVDSLNVSEGGVLLKKVYHVKDDAVWGSGFNCPDSSSPFEAQEKGCGDDYEKVEALTNGTCPWGSFQTWH